MAANMSGWKSGNRQIMLNMATTIVSYAVTLGISFFLAPYIVSRLGAAAYGFLGLSNNIIGFTALLTVALNSMSGRFISISYFKGDYDEANRYMASSVVGNFAMAFIIVVLFGVLTIFLEKIVNIPPDIVGDVKFLFTLLFVNCAVGLCAGFLGIPSFIKNRLDLSNIFGAIGNLFRVILIIIAYGFFPAHLWYIGAVAVICSGYTIIVNYNLYRRLTPELNLRYSFFRLKHVWEMTKEGAWNILTQFSSILNQGLQLLFANIFVSAYYMGIMSISSTLPYILLGIFSALGGNFHPEAVRLYAEKDTEGMRRLLVKGVRIMSALAAIPCAGIFAYGDIFYASWVPGQNYELLYCLTIITMVWIATTLPTQTLWYVFTITKTVRQSSVIIVRYGIANCVLAILTVNLFDDDLMKIIAIAGIQTVLGLLRFVVWLPFISAKVLDLPKYTFFWPLVRFITVTVVLTLISLLFKHIFISEFNWANLVGAATFTIVMGFPLTILFILSKNERKKLLNRIIISAR